MSQRVNFRLPLPPARGLSSICSSCCLMLARADQADLEKAYAKAIDKGYVDKATALECFIIEEEIYVSKATKNNRDLERKRSMRTVRTSANKIRA